MLQLTCYRHVCMCDRQVNSSAILAYAHERYIKHLAAYGIMILHKITQNHESPAFHWDKRSNIWLVPLSSIILCICRYSKICLKRPLKKKTKIGFQDRLSLNAGQKYCRMLSWSILQYFRPSLSYHLSLRPLFCLFLSGRLRQVLLYHVL